MANELELRNQRTSELIAPRLRIADNPWTRLVGLLGKKTLPVGDALMIKPSSSVHTFFMRFAMDAIFVDRDNQVLKVKRSMKPFRVAGARRCHAVIEMVGGSLDESDVQVGDQLALTEPGAV